MTFNPDLSKQAQDVIFSGKTVKRFTHKSSFMKFQQRAVYLRNIQIYIQIRRWILVNTLMKKFLKHKKEFQSLRKFVIFCQKMHFYQYINHLFDRIQITAISYIIDQTTRAFRTKFMEFSIMLPNQSQTQSKKLLKQNSMKNQSLSFRRWFRRLWCNTKHKVLLNISLYIK